jgi:hypothetical protein
MTTLATRFALTPAPSELAPLLRSARMWVLAARSGRPARDAIAPLLGRRGAAAFSTLMEALVVAWTEPFVAHPPCAANATADEMTLLALLAAGDADERAGSDWLLGEMLPPADVGRLHALAARAMAEISFPLA